MGGGTNCGITRNGLNNKPNTKDVDSLRQKKFIYIQYMKHDPYNKMLGYRKVEDSLVLRRRAIIISISQYSNNLQPLNFCKNDGQEMYKLLISLGYQIANNHALIGQIKYETMRDAIIDFFSDPDIKSDDTLIFYYSGHGVPDVDGDVYLCLLGNRS